MGLVNVYCVSVVDQELGNPLVVDRYMANVNPKPETRNPKQETLGSRNLYCVSVVDRKLGNPLVVHRHVVLERVHLPTNEPHNLLRKRRTCERLSLSSKIKMRQPPC